MAMGSEDYKNQKPGIGRIVHYQAAGRCQAAIITEVGTEGDVTLEVFTPGGGNENPKDVPHDEGDGGANQDRLEGTWHWPERV